MPTVMVEMGDLRSREDASVMTSAKGQERYAVALAVAVRTYLGRSAR